MMDQTENKPLEMGQTPLLIPRMPEMKDARPIVFAVIEKATDAQTGLSDLFTALSASPQGEASGVLLMPITEPHRITKIGPCLTMTPEGMPLFNELALRDKAVTVLPVYVDQAGMMATAKHIVSSFIRSVRLDNMPTPGGMQ